MNRYGAVVVGGRIAGASTAVLLARPAPDPGGACWTGGRGWALVGDAGYFKDPITTHGIAAGTQRGRESCCVR